MAATARAISGRALTLTISPALQPGETARVVYTAPSTSSQRLRDAAGNEVIGFVWDAARPAADDPALTGTPSVSGRSVVLSVNPAIEDRDTVRLQYTRPTDEGERLQDSVGNQVADFTLSAQEGHSATQTGSDRYIFGWRVVEASPPPPTSGSDQYSFGWVVAESSPPPPTSGTDTYDIGWTVAGASPPTPTSGTDTYNIGWTVADALAPPPTSGTDTYDIGWVVAGAVPPIPTTGTDDYSIGWTVAGGATLGPDFIVLPIDPKADPGTRVRVTYRLPDQERYRIQDAAGNQTAQFTIEATVPSGDRPRTAVGGAVEFSEQDFSGLIVHEKSNEVVGVVPYRAFDGVTFDIPGYTIQRRMKVGKKGPANYQRKLLADFEDDKGRNIGLGGVIYEHRHIMPMVAEQIARRRRRAVKVRLGQEDSPTGITNNPFQPVRVTDIEATYDSESGTASTTMTKRDVGGI